MRTDVLSANMWISNNQHKYKYYGFREIIIQRDWSRKVRGLRTDSMSVYQWCNKYPPGTDEHRLGLMLTGITIMPLHDSLGKFHDTLMEERKYLQKESAVKHSDRDMQTN